MWCCTSPTKYMISRTSWSAISSSRTTPKKSYFWTWGRKYWWLREAILSMRSTSTSNSHRIIWSTYRTGNCWSISIRIWWRLIALKSIWMSIRIELNSHPLTAWKLWSRGRIASWSGYYPSSKLTLLSFMKKIQVCWREVNFFIVLWWAILSPCKIKSTSSLPLINRSLCWARKKFKRNVIFWGK